MQNSLSLHVKDLYSEIMINPKFKNQLISMKGQVNLPLSLLRSGGYSAFFFDKTAGIPLLIPHQLIQEEESEGLLQVMVTYAHDNEEPLSFTGHFNLEKQIYRIQRVNITMDDKPYVLPSPTETYINS